MADVQVVLNQTYLGQQVRNVIHAFYSGPLDNAGRQDLADYIRSSWVASMLNTVQVSDWDMSSVSIRECAVVGPYALVPFTDGNLSGVAGNLDTVSQVSILASLINNGLVAPTRGRIYFAGITTQGIQSDGTWQQSYLDLVEALVNSWVGGLTAAGETFDIRIASRNPNGTCNVLNVVDNVVAQPIPAVQRRRRIGQGS